jgi:hypothetical protein
MRHLLSAALGLLLCAGCVGAEDDPSTVKDLRVLGMRMEPPELMAEACAVDPSNASGLESLLATLLQPVRLTALVEDPAGGGRELEYTLWACASQEDDTCEEDRVELARGVFQAGEVLVDLRASLGAAKLPDGTFLAQKVLEKDTYKGLGGLRMPLVLWVRGGDEQVYAQKLMVYGCRRFPEMQANVQPELPGVRVGGQPWEEGAPPELSGKRPFVLEAEDFSALEEPYVVPSFELKPVSRKESWELAWYTSLGTISPRETGGADYGGGVGRHRVEWRPPADAQAQEVRFWVVGRDGRGGLSWLTRKVRYSP